MAQRGNKIKPSKIEQKLESKKKVKKTQEFADEARVTDDRFKAVNFDPRFAPIAKKERKFKIDSRFSQVLSDSRFKTVGKVDKLGRKLNVPKNNQEMEEFYYLEGQEDGEDKEIEEEVEEETAPVAKGKKNKNDKLKNKEKANGKAKGKGQAEGKKPMKGFTEDGRFEWNEVSSEESDMEDIGLELGQYEEEEVGDLWEEEEQDVPEGDPTRRLAMVNYDWENTKASDIMLFLSSFAPRNGYIRNVKVYPSEFGLERMREEEKFGPQGIWKSGDGKNAPIAEEEEGKETKEKGKGKKKGKGKEKEKENGKEQVSEKPEKKPKIEDLEVDANAPWIIREEDDNVDIDPVKLRKYEQDRLKYYYAIIECDSVGTAKTIYEACDGLEMELTSIKVDLRYVPDDQTFQREPNEVCTEVPPTASVNCFLNRAVQHTNVKLTWDEPKVNRFKDLERKDIDDYDNMDLSKYIADSDSSDQDSEDEEEEITRKRELLLGNVTKDWKSDFDKKNKRRDEEIVIKFNPGFDELGNKILEKANPEKTKNKKRHQGKVKEDDDFFEEEEEVKTKEELKKEEEMLKNMVDDQDDRKKNFKANFQDERFSGIYKESKKFQIDPTSKHYKADDNRKWLEAQTTGRKKLKKE